MIRRQSAPQFLFQANNTARRRSPISLTPLIDVVFILLIFFMLVSNFMEWRAISLDAPGGAATRPSIEGALLVELKPGRLRLSGITIGMKDLASKITAVLHDKPNQRVVVETAPGVNMQAAVDVLDILSAAGVRNLSLKRTPKP
jgi:biopolymer transport protein ExbD